MTCTKAAPDCNNGTDTAVTEMAPDDPIQHTKDTAADPTMTHYTDHTTNHTHAAANQVTTHRITIHHIHIHPADQ